ncbi:MAG: hypothetical protein WB791_09370 [Waddliaceae bacterium]
MKEDLVRMSFDVPRKRHELLKLGCMHAGISLKDYMNELILKEIKRIDEKKLQKELRISIQQAKEGKIVNRGSFAQYAEDEI